MRLRQDATGTDDPAAPVPEPALSPAESTAPPEIPGSSFIDELAGGAAQFLDISLESWLRILLAVAVGLVAHAVLFALLRRFARRSDNALDDRFVRRIGRPAFLVLPLLALQFVLPATPELADVGPLRHLMSLLTIAAITLSIVAAVQATADLVKRRHDVTVADNYAARRMHTQVNVISRVLVVLITIIGIALALMTFPRVSELGTSLLASAGIVGIVVGFAARPVLENLIAGIQLALTQPINIDDVVIVEGEWGRIEEITTTYVVVRIWDDRRLICPFSKFIGEAFQNWTRRTSELLGTVFVHVDYTVPFDAVRAELRRIVEGSDRWDGRVCVLQVTDATPTTVELRALVSAASGPAAWDLRVLVREKLIEFLQREHPSVLPRRRVTLDGSRPDEGDGGGGGGATGPDQWGARPVAGPGGTEGASSMGGLGGEPGTGPGAGPGSGPGDVAGPRGDRHA